MNMDASLLATGHYARLDKSNGVKLLRAHDAGKDQTYFLAGLTSEQLKRALFPIGDMDKKAVRAIAQENGLVIGKHDGLMYYTLGQRRGLGIGGMNEGTGESWFVVGKDLKRNRLVVQQGEHEELFSTALTADKLSFISGCAPAKQFRCTAKFRYRQPDRGVTVTMHGDGATIDFDSPERAVTPGQWVVLYDGDACLGGGPIDEVAPLKALPKIFTD